MSPEEQEGETVNCVCAVCLWPVYHSSLFLASVDICLSLT